MPQPSLLDSLMWRLRSWEEIQQSSLFTKMNYSIIIMILVLLGTAVLQANSKRQASLKAGTEKRALEAPDFPPVEAQQNFEWRATEPLKFRHFKPKYFLTMALETLDPNELILMDKNYLDRITYRRQILKQHHSVVVGVNDDPRIRPAVVELYTFLMGTYLPTRYPSMFKLHLADFDTGKLFMLENLVTKELHPAQVTSTTQTITLLETLGKQLDEDLLLMLPEKNVADNKNQKYVLEAFITICPSGFNPSHKLGKKLRDIHEPVPGYDEKLESSMDRFFSKLEVGKYVKRVNWSVTTGTDLYAAGDDTNHAHEGDELAETDEIDLDKTFLRCERQTLHRLPKSKAIVFAFKTYLYPIQDIKDEGLGEALCEAIDGLKEGNVPQMHFYKRGVVWGKAVKRYLRS